MRGQGGPIRKNSGILTNKALQFIFIICVGCRKYLFFNDKTKKKIFCWSVVLTEEDRLTQHSKARTPEDTERRSVWGY